MSYPQELGKKVRPSLALQPPAAALCLYASARPPLPCSQLVASASLRAGQRQPPHPSEGAPLPGRIRCRAHAPCRCVALSLCCGCKNNGRCTPRARATAAGGFHLAARGAIIIAHPPTPSQGGALRYALSSPPAAARLPCAAGGASLSSPPSPPQGRYTPRYAVSAAVGGPVNAA